MSLPDYPYIATPWKGKPSLHHRPSRAHLAIPLNDARYEIGWLVSRVGDVPIAGI
jgi:hypothetical protein